MYDVNDVNDGKMIEIMTAIKIIIPQQIGSFSVPTSSILVLYLFAFRAAAQIGDEVL